MDGEHLDWQRRVGDDLSGAIALAAPEGHRRVLRQRRGSRSRCCVALHEQSRAHRHLRNDRNHSVEPGFGPRLERTVLDRELLVRGFLRSRYESESPLLLPALQSWFDAEDLRLREDITPGLGSLPAALEGLLTGSNFGKVLIDITKEEL